MKNDKKIVFKSFIKNWEKRKGNDGFSLLELVTGVGIVLILTLVGLMSFNGVNASAKQGAVNKAAYEVYDKASAYMLTGKNPALVEAEFNKKSNSKKISANVQKLENSRIRVTVNYVNDEAEATLETPDGKTAEDNTDPVIPNPGDETEPPNTIQKPAKFEMRCDTDQTQDLFGKAEAGAKAIATDENDNVAIYDKLTGYAGSRLTFKAGVTYKVVFTGKYTELKSSNINGCLRKVIDFGSDTGVTSLKFGRNIESVPKNIPKTVTNLNSAFLRSYSFNDPNIAYWDVSKVSNYDFMFSETKEFNQDLSGWNMRNAINTSNMFSKSDSYNNGDTGNNSNNPLIWNTPKIENLSSMFSNALSFNQDISSWDTSNVRSIQSMFLAAPLFNQDLSNWDTSNVESMRSVFVKAKAFNNGDAPGQSNTPLTWNTAKVKWMDSLFNQASSFNQNLDSFDTSDAGTMKWMFSGATLFNNGEASGLQNKPLNFNTDKVKIMEEMFMDARSFNQDVSNRTVEGNEYWNVYANNSFHQMFKNATKFNQDLSGWNINPNPNVKGSAFATGSAMSTNYNFYPHLRGYENLRTN